MAGSGVKRYFQRGFIPTGNGELTKHLLVLACDFASERGLALPLAVVTMTTLGSLADLQATRDNAAGAVNFRH